MCTHEKEVRKSVGNKSNCNFLQFVTQFWKIILLGTCKICRKTQLKISAILKIILFFTHLDKVTIMPSSCEISHPKLLSAGDMDDFIRPCSDFTMRGTPINLQMG